MKNKVIVCVIVCASSFNTNCLDGVFAGLGVSLNKAKNEYEFCDPKLIKINPNSFHNNSVMAILGYRYDMPYVVVSAELRAGFAATNTNRVDHADGNFRNLSSNSNGTKFSFVSKVGIPVFDNNLIYLGIGKQTSKHKLNGEFDTKKNSGFATISLLGIEHAFSNRYSVAIEYSKINPITKKHEGLLTIKSNEGSSVSFIVYKYIDMLHEST